MNQTENERLNIWPEQLWKHCGNGETVRVDAIALSGKHVEATVVEPTADLRRAIKAGLDVPPTVGQCRRIHFTHLLRSWRRV